MVLTAEEQLPTETKSPDLHLTAENPKPAEEKVDLTINLPTRTEQLQTWFTLLDQFDPAPMRNRLLSDAAAEKLNEEHQEGDFTRTFKLVRGANLWWFHDATKRTRFINWLINLN